jgi:carbonic anhydrase
MSWSRCLLPRRLLGALLACATLPVAAQDPGSERMAEQLRQAIERANAQRAASTGRPPARTASQQAAEVPSVTLNVDKAGTVRVASQPPTSPTPPAAPAPRASASAPRAPAAAAAPAVSAPAAAAQKGKEKAAGARPATAATVSARAPAPALAPRPVVARPADRTTDIAIERQYERARAIAHGLPIPAHARLPQDEERAPRGARPAPRPPVPWGYSGEGGPAAWASLQPEFQQCGSGQRQSPIHIESHAALQGPNEVLGLDYRPSSGTVLHDGRTIRVQVEGENRLQVRGSSYRLEYLDFRHPAEEVVDHGGFAMGVHLVHRNAQGQTAILAVLLQPGEPSAFIDKVWTYIPLDAGDSVRMPADWFDLAQLLPQDQRYYQFFGSLTQPPCTEGVLWMVLKQPVTLSPEQLRLFAQMFPANARPVQALNGRIVRDAQ